MCLGEFIYKYNFFILILFMNELVFLNDSVNWMTQ